jgi:hypothetical protein
MEIRVKRSESVRQTHCVEFVEGDTVQDWVFVEVDHRDGKVNSVKVQGGGHEAELSNHEIKALLEVLKEYRL